MLERIETLAIARAVGKYSAARQSLIAQNVANADTPGYRAKDLVAFKDMVQPQAQTGLRTTHAKHLSGSSDGAAVHRHQTINTGNPAPNGNSVSLEKEIVRGAEAKQQHDLALAVYRSALSTIRLTLGRGM